MMRGIYIRSKLIQGISVKNNISNLIVTRHKTVKSYFLLINVSTSDSATLVNSSGEIYVKLPL